MLTVKPGMNRGELLKVFTNQGGMAAREQETYISRDCSYFHVDVTFRPAGNVSQDKEGRLIAFEDDRDVILTVSRPYLDFVAMD